MSDSFQCSLELPGHPHSLPVARALAEQLGRLAGLTDPRLPEAAEAAVQNILRFAPGNFEVKAELNGHDLIFHFVDRGAPMQGEVHPEAGHGLATIARAVDELRWVPLGRNGKELFLRVARPHPDVRETEAPEPIPHDAPLAPAQEYGVRRLQPEDAPGVARLTYQVYGYGYQHEELYFPERLVAMNRSGLLYSMVALDAAGEVVGHYALELAPDKPVAEAGEALVSPAHRGRKLMERMGAQLESDAPGLGLKGIFSEAVTLHPFSQKAAEGFGRTVCGLVINLIPGKGGLGRTTCVFYFQHLGRREPHHVYPPARYRGIVMSLYSQLNDPAVACDGEPLRDPHGALRVELQPDYKYGNIRVLQPGQDSAAHIAQALKDLRELGEVPSIYLELPLSHPGTPQVAEEVRSLGFLFSALTPLFSHEGDILRLQWLADPIEPERIHLNSEASRELLAFIQQDRP